MGREPVVRTRSQWPATVHSLLWSGDFTQGYIKIFNRAVIIFQNVLLSVGRSQEGLGKWHKFLLSVP